MGNHITLGFRETGRKALPVLLYVGQDSGEATNVFMNPPPEIVRTEVLHHVPFTRQRTHDGSGAGYVGPEVAVAAEAILPVTIEDLPEDVRKEIEEAQGRIAGLEDENADLLAEIEDLKKGTGVSPLLTEEPPAAGADAPAAAGDTLKLGLPPKGGGKKDK